MWWAETVLCWGSGGGSWAVTSVTSLFLDRGPPGQNLILGFGPIWANPTLRQIQRARSCVLALGPHWGSRESPRKPGSPRKNRESPEKRTFGRQSKKSGFQGREVTDPLKAVEGKIGQRTARNSRTDRKEKGETGGLPHLRGRFHEVSSAHPPTAEEKGVRCVCCNVG